jgi:hypothetical protein
MPLSVQMWWRAFVAIRVVELLMGAREFPAEHPSMARILLCINVVGNPDFGKLNKGQSGQAGWPVAEYADVMKRPWAWNHVGFFRAS